jgi:hypothetical protein
MNFLQDRVVAGGFEVWVDVLYEPATDADTVDIDCHCCLFFYLPPLLFIWLLLRFLEVRVILNLDLPTACTDLAVVQTLRSSAITPV